MPLNTNVADVAVYLWDQDPDYVSDVALTRLEFLPRVGDHLQLFEAGIAPTNNSPQRGPTDEPMYEVVGVLHKVWKGPSPTDPAYRKEDDDGAYHGDLVQLTVRRMNAT